MHYIYGVSGPSPLTESTDSMIMEYVNLSGGGGIWPGGKSKGISPSV